MERDTRKTTIVGGEIERRAKGTLSHTEAVGEIPSQWHLPTRHVEPVPLGGAYSFIEEVFQEKCTTYFLKSLF